MRDPDRLFDIIHRKGADEIGVAFGEGLHLTRVIGAGFLDRHAIIGPVAIAARTDIAADRHRRIFRLEARPDIEH
jgi:hypothetical protein